MTTPSNNGSKAAILKVERDILTWFFANIAGDVHLVQRGKLVTGAEMHPLYSKAQETLRERLAKGWTPDSVQRALIAAYDVGLKTASLYEVLPSLPSDLLDRNLINPEDFYVHPALRLSSPGKMEIDSTMGMISMSAPWEIGPRTYFSLGDLCTYYREKLSAPWCTTEELTAALNWFLTHGTHLDELLFAIDSLRFAENDLAQGDPWQLRSQLKEARAQRRWCIQGQVQHGLESKDENA